MKKFLSTSVVALSTAGLVLAGASVAWADDGVHSYWCETRSAVEHNDSNAAGRWELEDIHMGPVRRVCVPY